MTELAAKALELAMADLGVTEHPHGSNRGPEVDRYLREVGLDPEKGHYPWCAAAVCAWVQRAANAISWPLQLKRSARVHRLAALNYALALGAPEPGSMFLHLNADGTGHAGLVIDVLPVGDLDTISGNTDALGSRTGGSVARVIHTPGYAQVFLRLA